MDYARLQGYQPNEVMAIGDNLNDESMIRMAGVGVGQGMQRLMEEHDHLFPDNHIDIRKWL